MTIPIIPGPFSALGQGLNAGLESYRTAEEQKYERANAGARLVLGLIQSGQLDPNAQYSDPAFQQQLAQARIPVPPPQAVVPSVPAQKARAVTQIAQGTQPGSTEQRLLFDIPGLGSQISEEDLKQGLLAVKNQALKDPALARLMADVLPSGVAQNREAAMQASAAPKEYDFAAENFVAQAGLALPKTPDGQVDFQKVAANAKALAAADPQYRDLVANGQLSDEYFARAARGWQRLNEEDRIKYADIAARRLAAEREARYYYGTQDKSYDQDIQRLQKQLDQNKPGEFEQFLLPPALDKARKGLPLNPQEQDMVQKAQARAQIQQQIDQLQNERQDLRDRSIHDKNPVVPGQQFSPPLPAEAQARRQKAAGVTNPTGGGKQAAPKIPPRNAGENPADYWERLVKSGIPKDRATAIVQGDKP